MKMKRRGSNNERWFRFRSSFFLLAGVALALVTLNGRSASAQSLYAVNVPAPELVGGPWLNTQKQEPIKLAGRKGKVTVVEFWTFG